MRNYLTIGGLICCLAMLAGCTPSGGAKSDSTQTSTWNGDGPFEVVCTTGMVADIVREVGGPHIKVVQLMGAGVDPHLYKATRDDVAKLMNGQMVIYSGLMLEGKMTDSLIKIARQKPVVAVTERLDETTLLEPEDFGGHPDPHVWMDVAAWSKAVESVAAALAEFDPKHADDYRKSSEAYRAQLTQLDDYGKKSMASIPTDSRLLITSHDAFNYFGRAYGLEVQGVQGISTESEAGLQQINSLVDQIVQRKVKAVFVESSVPRKNIQALVEGAKARGHEVAIGGELFSDAMGSEGTYEGTYVGMIDHNITTVARALGGDAPERGMQGKLSHE